MSPLLSAEVNGQFLDAKLFTEFDGELTFALDFNRPVRAYETIAKFLRHKAWSIGLFSYTSSMLVKHFGSANSVDAA